MKIKKEQIIKANGTERGAVIIGMVEFINKLLETWRGFENHALMNKKISMQSICDKLDVNYKQLHNYLTGKIKMSPEYFDKLIEFQVEIMDVKSDFKSWYFICLLKLLNAEKAEIIFNENEIINYKKS